MEKDIEKTKEVKTENEETIKPVKKSNKGIIVLLIIIIIGLVGYICYDKGVFDNLLGRDEVIEEPKQETKLTEEEVNKLREKLILTFRKEYTASLYFDHKVTLDTMSDELVNYLIQKYGDSDSTLEEKIDNWMDDHNNNIGYGDDVIASVSVKDINNILKSTFNTSATVSPKESDNYLYHYNGSFIKYNSSTNNFDVVSAVTVDEFGIPKSKMVKYDQSGDELYIYEKVLICKFGQTDASSRCYTPSSIANIGNPFVEVTKDSKIKINANGKVAFDFDYIFEKYGDRIDTYKTTFKKADNGNYYWYSSEIVNE